MNKLIKNNSIKNYLKAILCLLSLIFLNACEDYGCIDADDFGEYEIYTFPVNANRLSEYCEYKKGLPPTSQPFGIKECITNNQECAGLSPDDCGERCQIKCYGKSEDNFKILINQATGSPHSPTGSLGYADPPWVAVGGGNNQLSIEENSQILITAQGTIDLGGVSPERTLSISTADIGNKALNQLHSSLNIGKFIGGESLEVNFYNKFSNKVGTESGATTDANFFETTALPAQPIDNNFNYYTGDVANGARRILAYSIPLPEGYTPYNTYNFPLDPEPDSWPCKIDGGKLICSDDTECASDDSCDTYKESLGVTQLTVPDAISSYNKKFSQVFNVNNKEKEKARYKNGTGFIRYTNDGLKGIDVTPDPAYIVNLNLTEVISGPGSKLIFPNSTKDYAIVFVKSKLDPNVADCNIDSGDIQYTITKTDSLGSPTSKNYPITPVPNVVNNSNSVVINKEDLSTVRVKQVGSKIFTNCKLDAYLYEFHELQFEQSGYIEFGIANQALGSDANKKSASLISAANCNLSFKIFHEDNDDEDEFANFTYPLSSSAPSKPSKKVGESGVEHKVLFQNANPLADAVCLSNCVNNPKKYFIRKGQKLSFHPLSWKGNWTPNPGNTEPAPAPVNCGVGFYVKFTPRPAVFCPQFKVKEYLNVNQDSDADNNCISKTEASGLKVYCEIDFSQCTENVKSGTPPTNNDKFCPRECIPTDFSKCRAVAVVPSSNIDKTLTSSNIFNLSDPDLALAVNTNCAEKPISKCYSSASQTSADVYGLPLYGGTCGSSREASTILCKSYTSLLLEEPYKSMKNTDGTTPLAAATDESDSSTDKMNQKRCNKCLDELKKDAQKKYFQNTLSTESLQQCYDLEKYTGTVRALQEHIKKIDALVALTIGSVTISADDRKAKAAYLLLENNTIQNYDVVSTNLALFNGNGNFKKKGLKKLGSFDGNFGNLYPVKYLKSTTVSPALPIFSTENPITVTSPSYIKFIILDDVTPVDPATPLPDYFEANIPATSSTTHPFVIKINNKDSYSNGDKLSVVICKEGSSAGNDCSAFKNLIQESNLSNPLMITQYTANPDALNQLSNYKFNEFGQLIRITAEDSSNPTECRRDGMRAFIGTSSLCFDDGANSNNDNPSDDNKYRIAFKIFDNQTVGNCRDSGGGAFQHCIQPVAPASTPACNKYRSINLNWNGKAANSGYCSASQAECEEKYICNESPYFNNTGHYDVAVKIKRGSKVKVANFINSIISPVLEEVDGVNKIENTAFEIGSDKYNLVYNAIRALPYYANVNNQDYFSPNNDISIDVTDAQLSSFKAIDDKIVGFYTQITDGSVGSNAGPSSANQSLNLNPNKKTPTCRERFFISHIVYANIASIKDENKIDKNCKVRSHRENTMIRIRTLCQGKSFCNITINPAEEWRSRMYIVNSSAQVSPGFTIPALETNQVNPTDDQVCNNDKKFAVTYLYSISDETFYKENQIKRLYNLILENRVYQSFLTLSVVLMFSFYVMGFLMCVSELKQSEIIDRLVKVGIIYLFTNPSFGWIWFDKFFVTFFKNGTDFLTFLMASFFDESGQVESALLANDFSNKSVIFGGTDRVIGLFINNDIIHKKILSLFFYKFFGILYAMIIYYCAITYVYTISNAVLIYLTTQFFISILFSVGPFFFVFILFKQTKTFFDNWINSLIGFALQQIFLIFTLSLFNSFLYLIIKLTLGYRVCWDSVWEINLLSSKISLLSFWTPQDAPSYISNTIDPTASGSPSGIPTLPKLLSLWSLCVIMKAFLGQITDLVATLSGGASATEFGTGIANSMNKAIGTVKEKVAKAYNKSGLKVMDRLDQKVFDSGSMAKSARKKDKATDDQNRQLKSKMLKDGNKAVSDYKTNKSEEFSKLSEAGKREKLADVKKKAMISTAKQAGKGDKSIEKLMSSTKGSSYKGDNVFAFAASHALDYLRNNKTSMNAKAASVDTGMTKSEMKTTLKNLDGPEKRQNFMDSIKDGRIQQKESGVKSSLKDATKADVSKEERSAAVKQLEKSGEISKQTYDNKPMTGGGKANNVSNAIDNVAGNAKVGLGLVKRSPEEENKIIAKVQENRLAQSFNKGSNMSGKNIDKLDSFAKYLDKKDNKGDVEDRVKEKEETKKPNQDRADEIEKDVNKKAVKTLEPQKEKNDIAIGGAKEKLASSKKTLDNAQKAIDGNDYHKKMDALKSKIDKGENVTSQDRKDFKELSEKEGGKVGEEFGDKVTARSNASAEVAKDEGNLKNLEIKGEKIDTALGEAQSKQGSNVAADSVAGGAGGGSQAATPPAGPDGASPPPAGGGAETPPPASPDGASPPPGGTPPTGAGVGEATPPPPPAAPAGGAGGDATSPPPAAPAGGAGGDVTPPPAADAGA